MSGVLHVAPVDHEWDIRIHLKAKRNACDAGLTGRIHVNFSSWKLKYAALVHGVDAIQLDRNIPRMLLLRAIILLKIEVRSEAPAADVIAEDGTESLHVLASLVEATADVSCQLLETNIP